MAVAKMKVGAEGMTKIRSMNGSVTVKGAITGTVYRFDLHQVLFVDNRDMIFMLGEDYWLSE